LVLSILISYWNTSANPILLAISVLDLILRDFDNSSSGVFLSTLLLPARPLLQSRNDLFHLMTAPDIEQSLSFELPGDMSCKLRNLPELHNFPNYFTLCFSFPSILSFSLPQYLFTVYLSKIPSKIKNLISDRSRHRCIGDGNTRLV
jgi:hypothetical protein